MDLFIGFFYKEVLKEESIYIKVNPEQLEEELHIKRFYSDKNCPPVLMIHGSIENGKIFYSSSGKGLAPYLAKNGYDVFVVDLRGRGLSTPSIGTHSKHGYAEILREDFHLYINKIKELKGDVPQHWVAHSWGGVLMLAFLARNFKAVKIASMILIATKRTLTVKTLQKVWQMDVMWGLMGRFITRVKGYLPAKEYKFGSDNETRKSHREIGLWIKSKKWIDWNDQFDYIAALRKLKLAPCFYLVGSKDTLLAHPQDAKLFMRETGNQKNEFKIVGKATGHKNDYGHNDIITHEEAPVDVYPLLLSFMKKNS